MIAFKRLTVLCLLAIAWASLEGLATAQDRPSSPPDRPSSSIRSTSDQSAKEPTNRELLERIEALELFTLDRQEESALSGPRDAAGTERAAGTGWAAGTHGASSIGAAAGGSSMGVSSGLMGHLGQTTRFSRTFNPSIGVVIDMIGNTNTSNASGDHEDRFWMRAAELNLAAQIDPFGYAYLVVEGSEDEDIAVAEAAAVMNRLPANFSVKAGKILADFGKFGQRHVHELPFVEKPLVYYDYLGGSLNSTGVELHNWFGLTDEIPVRWSAGIYNDFEGHGHRIWGGHDHAHADVEPFGKREWDNYAYNGRITAYGDLTDTMSLQVGGGCLYAPNIRDFHEDATTGAVERVKTHRTLAGADVTFKWIDPESRQEFICGIEGFASQGTFYHEDDDAIEDGDALGGYAWCEYAPSPYWAVGAMGSTFQLARHDNIGQQEYSSWVTWKISHFNWLRFQYRYNDQPRHGDHFSGEDFSEFILQWAIVFGSHSHGLDW